MSEADKLHGYYLEDLEVGMTAAFAKTVTEADIVMFAGVSGDTNPVHINAEFAAGTMFKERIAHGMLSASFLSTVFGTKLPGPGAIYMNQNLNFKAPVHIGDTVNASVTLREINDGGLCGILRWKREHTTYEPVNEEEDLDDLDNFDLGEYGEYEEDFI